MWQLGGMILLALSAWGYIALHDAKQREIGAADVRAELAEAAKKQAEADTLKALEGERYASELADKAIRQRRSAQAELETMKLARGLQSDQLAAQDADYADWRSRYVPRAAADQLRAATVVAADPRGDRVPGRPDVQAQPDVPGSTGPADQSWLGKLRVRLGLATQGGVGGK